MGTSALKQKTIASNERLLQITLALILTALTSTVFAQPEYRYDEKNRVISVVGDDGTVIFYSYDKNGNQIKNDDGQKGSLASDANGKTSN